MVKLLYEDLGLRCPVLTKKGAKSSSEAALIRLAGKHAVIDVILEWRKWKKYASTYLRPWIAKGPILHANYGFTGTTTGRLNSTMVRNKRSEKKLGATLHQCPRDGFIRNLVAPRGYVEMPWEEISKIEPDEWCILAADLSQLELRLVAHASGDRKMIQIFHTGSDIRHFIAYHSDKNSKQYRGEKCPECDIHFCTAKSLTHGDIDKETRKKAKAVNFGFVYGMFAKKFVIYAKEKFSLELSLQEGERYRETFFDTYSGLLPWHNRTEAFVTQNGYIDSVFGRRRHLPEAQDFEIDEWKRREAIRQGINSPIQGGGSDLNLLIAALMMGRSDILPWKFKVDPQQCFLVGSAHDSLIMECKKTYVQTMREGIKYTTSHINEVTRKYFNFEFRVPIVMDAEAFKDHWEGEKLIV
jgi:DNA polymerase-1